MSDDLITWLRNVLDTEERIAREASQAYPHSPGAQPPRDGVHWRWVAGESWYTVNLDAVDEFVAEPGYSCNLATVEEWPNDYGRMMPRTYMYEAVEVDVPAARLITRHDPASVLADIVAKRAILDLHKPVDGLVWDATGNETHGGKVCGTCCSVDYRDTEQPLGDAYPCRTVRLLAEAYADQPGYREEWQR